MSLHQEFRVRKTLLILILSPQKEFPRQHQLAITDGKICCLFTRSTKFPPFLFKMGAWRAAKTSAHTYYVLPFCKEKLEEINVLNCERRGLVVQGVRFRVGVPGNALFESW